MQGTATVDFANAVHFGSVGGTERACSGDEGATEKAVLAMFQGTANAVASGGELTLSKGAAELVFRWDPPASGATDPSALTGTTWHLAAAAGEPVNDDQVLTIAGDGTLTGNTGCDQITGRADVQPGTIAFSGVPEADASCTVASGSTLSSFLQGRQVWSVRDGRLVISGAGAQAFAMVFTSDTPAPPPTSTPLVGTTWHLASITSGDGRYRTGAPPAEPSTLKFTDNGFSVHHICYTQQGDASTTNDTITMSNARAVDAHPCPFQPGRDGAANIVDSILSGAAGWSIDHGTLTITKDGTGTLTYSTSAATDDLPLVGTDWRLETAVPDDGTELPADGQRFAIDALGQVVASDGVNTISGPVRGATMAWSRSANSHDGLVGSTAADPVRDVIDEVIQQGDIGYRIIGDALTLSSGLAQLIYRASADAPSGSILGSWNLAIIEHGIGPDGSASQPEHPVLVDVSGDSIGIGANDAAPASIEGDTLTVGEWVNGAVGVVPNKDLSRADSEFVLGELLTGTCTYTVDGDQLTIIKDGVGAIVLTRA